MRHPSLLSSLSLLPRLTPRSNYVSAANLRPWNAHYATFARNPRVRGALGLALAYRERAPAALRDDGDVAPLPPRQGGSPPAAAAAATAPAAAAVAEDEQERRGGEKNSGGAEGGGGAGGVRPVAVSLARLRVHKAQLGRALRANHAPLVAHATRALCGFAYTAALISALQLGAVAAHVARHADPQVAQAGRALVAHLRAQCVRAAVERGQHPPGVAPRKRGGQKRARDESE